MIYEIAYASVHTAMAVNFPPVHATSAEEYVHALLSAEVGADNYWRPLLAGVLNVAHVEYHAENKTLITPGGSAVTLADFIVHMEDCVLENDGMEFYWP